MKRDMDLVRSILLAVEQLPFDGSFHDISVPGHTEEEVTYHVKLLHDAGLIEATDLSSRDGVCWKPKNPTYQGHEFLDAARNDNIWSAAKDWVHGTAGVLTLESLKIALPRVVERLLRASS